MKHLKQLITLAEKLPTIPREQFTMMRWGNGRLEVERKGFGCGFAGCAIGWMPKLVRGQKLVSTEATGHPIYLLYTPIYKGTTGMSAVALYFDITLAEAVYLFGTTHRNGLERARETPAMVSRRIFDFLRRKGAIE